VGLDVLPGARVADERLGEPPVHAGQVAEEALEPRVQGRLALAAGDMGVEVDVDVQLEPPPRRRHAAQRRLAGGRVALHLGPAVEAGDRCFQRGDDVRGRVRAGGRELEVADVLGRQLPASTGVLERGDLDLEDAERPVEYVSGPDGERYERRTSVRRGTRGRAEELRILVQVQRGGRFGRLNPLAEELILATPDGEMTGEYTLAGEGNDPRRYRFG